MKSEGRSLEDLARDLLAGCGVPGARNYTDGDVMGLAQLLSKVDELLTERKQLRHAVRKAKREIKELLADKEAT